MAVQLLSIPKIGPTFGPELCTANANNGVAWNSDGQIILTGIFTDAQLTVINQVIAAHDPTKV